MRHLSPLRAALPVTVAALILAACGGGGGSTTPSVVGPSTNPQPSPVATATPTPTPTATPTSPPTASSSTIGTGDGEVNGVDNQFTPNDGNTSTGGQGQTVDGDACVATMSNNYHVHAFLGLYVNGQEIAIPDGTGMVNPQGEGTYQGFPNQTEYATCFYDTHTHDPSGMIHMESTDPNNVPQTGSIFTLGNYLDVWGMKLTATGFGPYTGAVTVITSGQLSRGGPGTNEQIPATTYSVYAGDPNQIALYSHEVIWIEVGAGNPTLGQLPNVRFVNEW